MQPKNRERLIRFRRHNRRLPRRRLDIPTEKLSYRFPEFLAKFTTETGKILPRRTTGISAQMHRRITREIKRARSLNLLP